MCINSKDIVIIGNGGCAHEAKFIIDRLNEQNASWNFLGFIDQQEGENVIGDDEFVLNRTSELAVVVAIGNPDIRERLIKKYKKNSKIVFPNLIDPSVIYSSSVSLGVGNIICANTVLTVNITVGDYNFVNLGCTISHDTVIGNYNTVNSGSCISGNVRISNGCYIGTGAKIIQGKFVSEGAIIGAGAVVVKNVQENCTVVGVPARVIKIQGK